MTISTDELSDQVLSFVSTFGPKLVSAILVLVVGLWLAKTITSAALKIAEKRKLDKSLQGFFKGLLGGALKVMVVITAMGMLGVEMTSFIAILGAAGLAVGMALSGTLQNFAGGVMILIFKPYKVGDVIDAQGYIGCVSEIAIFNTIMKNHCTRRSYNYVAFIVFLS